MLNKFLLIFGLSLLFCSTASGQEGRFTLVPQNGRVPFEATCFDGLATAKLMTWREFLEQEVSQRYVFEHQKFILEKDLEVQGLQITLDETLIRYRIEIGTRDKELEELRTIIKKNKKVNMPVVVAVSILGGVALGIAGAYAIDRAVR